jgi:hypothetical protein
MDTWTQDEDGAWKSWGHADLALDALADDQARIPRVLFVETDLSDDGRVLAMVRLARRLTDGTVSVMAAHSHPTRAWIASILGAGAEQALFLPKPNGGPRPTVPLVGAESLDDAICPALHARLDERVTLSVCGRHHDRMVLARCHFDRWCLRAKHACPYWREEKHA